MSSPSDKRSRDYGKPKGLGGGGLPKDPGAAARITSIKEDAPVMRAMKLAPQNEVRQYYTAPGFQGGVAGMSRAVSDPFKKGALLPSSMKASKSMGGGIIDKESYFQPQKSRAVDMMVEKEGEMSPAARSNWIPTRLRPVPAYYPLEKSHRVVQDESLSTIAARVSDCLRVLSVQANYDNDLATASLHTPEHVEIHLSLWNSPPKYPEGTVIELQRRKGCSVTFHRYSRFIMDAAEGDFDSAEHTPNDEEGERTYSKMAERLLSSASPKGNTNEKKNSYMALEIAAGLLKKDRMDARQLGMESLCLLTDPRRTGLGTAKIASRVVLLGTVHEEESQEMSMAEDEDDLLLEMSHLGIREAILSLVQFRRLGDDGEIDYEDEDDCDSDEDDEDRHPEEREHMDLMHNLALAVLSNALDVLENYDVEVEEAKKPSASTPSKSTVANSFMSETKEISNRDILTTLVDELRKAGEKPHDACLSAKCLRCLCRASEDARRRARDLDAAKVVCTALDVGQQTHAKLESETRKVLKTLNDGDGTA